MSAALAKKKGPAAAPTAPDHGPTKSQEDGMNAHSNTPSARPALADLDDLYSEAAALVHQLRYLMADLEEGFRLSRGKQVGGGFSFTFQLSGIDAKLWLTSEAWNKASDLRDAIVGMQKARDAEDVRRAAA